MYVAPLVCSGLIPRGRRPGRDQLIKLGYQVKWLGLYPAAQSLTSFQQGTHMTKHLFTERRHKSVRGKFFLDTLILRVFQVYDSLPRELASAWHEVTEKQVCISHFGEGTFLEVARLLRANTGVFSESWTTRRSHSQNHLPWVVRGGPQK